jgi:hypothetical protein
MILLCIPTNYLIKAILNRNTYLLSDTHAYAEYIRNQSEGLYM